MALRRLEATGGKLRVPTGGSTFVDLTSNQARIRARPGHLDDRRFSGCRASSPSRSRCATAWW
jgi:hypothetical protein